MVCTHNMLMCAFVVTVQVHLGEGECGPGAWGCLWSTRLSAHVLCCLPRDPRERPGQDRGHPHIFCSAQTRSCSGAIGCSQGADVGFVVRFACSSDCFSKWQFHYSTAVLVEMINPMEAISMAKEIAAEFSRLASAPECMPGLRKALWRDDTLGKAILIEA